MLPAGLPMFWELRPLVAATAGRCPARHSPLIDRALPFPGFPGIAEQLFDPRWACATRTRTLAGGSGRLAPTGILAWLEESAGG